MERQHIATEAAIFAEGTPYTRDDLLAEWNSLTDEQREETTPQRFFAKITEAESQESL